MENTTLVRLFYILNTTEKRKIKKKLESLDNTKDMLMLFNYLDKNIKKPKKLEKEKVFESIYKTTKKDDDKKLTKVEDKKLTQLRYKLYGFIEDEIVIGQILNSNNKEHLLQKELILLDYFNDKVVPSNKTSVEGIHRLADKKMTDVENLVKSTKEQDIFYHLNLIRLSHYIYYNLSTEIRGEGKQHLEQLMRNLDVFYSLAKLRYSFEILQRRRLYNENIEIFFFEEMYQFSKSLVDKEFPLVSIYRQIADLSISLSKEKIIDLQSNLFEKVNHLGKRDLANSFNLLLNFIMQINDELSVSMSEKKYEIYKFILDERLFMANGEIRPLILVNFAKTCLEVQKYDEILKRLNFYADYIPKNYKEKTITLCNAYYFFGKMKYKKCFSELHEKPFLPFNLQAKILKLKALYEIEFTLNEEPNILLYDAIRNFERYVRNQKKDKKLNSQQSQLCLNFSKILSKLIDINYTKNDLLKIAKDYSPFNEKEWVYEKIKNE